MWIESDKYRGEICHVKTSSHSFLRYTFFNYKRWSLLIASFRWKAKRDSYCFFSFRIGVKGNPRTSLTGATNQRVEWTSAVNVALFASRFKRAKCVDECADDNGQRREGLNKQTHSIKYQAINGAY